MLQHNLYHNSDMIGCNKTSRVSVLHEPTNFSLQLILAHIRVRQK